jgi:hypothetical protein
MKQVFTREGWSVLSPAWATLAAAAVAGVAIVLGSNWYYEKEKRDTANAGRRLQDARVRLDAARRERDSLQESSDVFRTLVERGLLQSERRLELVELVNALHSRHQLFALDYEVFPQRPLQLSGGRVFNAVEVLASRVKLRARALHEGDIVAFIDELSRSRQGFYPVDRCTLKRIEAPAESLQPRIEAECWMEWITLKDKGAARAG